MGNFSFNCYAYHYSGTDFPLFYSKMPYSAGRMLASKIAYSARTSAGRIYPHLQVGHIEEPMTYPSVYGMHQRRSFTTCFFERHLQNNEHYLFVLYTLILGGGGGGCTPPQYLYGYVPPNGVVILGLLI